MSFEERIDRLTQRHEAFAQSLELMRLDSEAQMRKLEEQRRNLELLRESAADLLRVARMHEDASVGWSSSLDLRAADH